jgi:hypothetical protein
MESLPYFSVAFIAADCVIGKENANDLNRPHVRYLTRMSIECLRFAGHRGKEHVYSCRATSKVRREGESNSPELA